jgi:hypothetical protein
MQSVTLTLKSQDDRKHCFPTFTPAQTGVFRLSKSPWMTKADEQYI